MKKIIYLVALLSLTLTGNAHKGGTIGQYEGKQAVLSRVYFDKESCEAADGEFDQEMDACFVYYTNKVSLIDDNSGTRAEMDLIIHNGRQCSFEGKMMATSNKTLLATNGSCSVSITLEDDYSVSVSGNEGCHEFCGIGGFIEASFLKKLD